MREKGRLRCYRTARDKEIDGGLNVLDIGVSADIVAGIPVAVDTVRAVERDDSIAFGDGLIGKNTALEVIKKQVRASALSMKMEYYPDGRRWEKVPHLNAVKCFERGRPGGRGLICRGDVDTQLGCLEPGMGFERVLQPQGISRPSVEYHTGRRRIAPYMDELCPAVITVPASGIHRCVGALGKQLQR